MFDVSRLSALASSVPSLPSSPNVAKGLGLGLSALFIRSCFRCKPIQENFFKKLGLASLQAFLFEGAALLGAYGINEGSKYLIGKKFTQLHIPINVALTVLGVTTFFIFMHQENGNGEKRLNRELNFGSPAASPQIQQHRTPTARNRGGWTTPVKGARQLAGAVADTFADTARVLASPSKVAARQFGTKAQTE